MNDLESVGFLHPLKEPQAFLFVFNEWISLPIRTQIHRAAQVFHCLQMLHPEKINGLQKEPPHCREERFAELLFFLFSSCCNTFVNRRDASNFLLHGTLGADQERTAARINALALDV